MSKSVDDRIVKMGFENRQFEQGISQSVSSLDKLKKGLNLEGATKGLENLDRASRSFSLVGISDALTGISSKFSSMGIIGITTLQNLTNSAVNAGKNMIKALTIDPITTGFNEYELKMGAIQTIMAGTGKSLEEVNGYLSDLNAYSDRTIYSFADMTQNIGKFTNAGVELETAVNAIKGISNEAALSGANAEEASRAMYNLSQAMSMGYVQLIDWKSIEMANMGTMDFKNNLLKTAIAMGTVTKAGDGYVANGKSFTNVQQMFKDGLQEQWLTTDVMIKSLSEYSDETTDLGKRAYAAAQDVKTITQMLGTMKEAVQSGWAMSWEYIIGDKNQAVKTLTAVNNAFGALIGPSTDARNEMLMFWNANGGRDALIEAISNAFKALGAVLKPIGEAFREVFPAMTGKRLVEITKKLRDLTAKFKIGKTTTDAIKTSFKGLFSVLDIGVQVVKTLAQGAMVLLNAIIPIGGGVLGITESFGGFLIAADKSVQSSGILNAALESLKKILDKLPDSVKGFDKMTAIFENFSDSVVKVFNTVKDTIFGTLGEFNFDKIFAVINGSLLAAVLLGLKTFIDGLKKGAKKGPGFVKNITEIFTGVKDCLKAYQNQLNAGILVKIATAIGILAASLFILSTIDPAKLAAATVAMSAMFAELLGSLMLFQKFAGGMGFKAVLTTIPMIIALSAAILILSAALKVISTLNWKELAVGLTGVAALAGILVASSKLLSKSSGALIRSSFGFILFATAILILAEAVKILGNLDVKQLAKGLVSIGVLCTELVVFMKVIDMSGMSVRATIGILVLASALALLAVAVKIFGSMNLKELAKGLGAVAIMLGMLSLFMKVQTNPAEVLAMAAALMLMGTAMIAFATAIGILGSMSLTTLGKGLGALAGALLIMGLAMKGMQTGLPGAAALLVMAAGIAILAPALVLLGSMKLKSIGKALVALFGTFLILGAAAVVLTPLIPALLGVSAAIALLGVACLAVGTGIVALATGLTTLAASGSAWQETLKQLVVVVANLIPVVLKKFGEGLAEMAVVIGEKAPVFIAAAMKLLNSLLDAIVKNVPIFVDKGISLVVALLEGIASQIPDVIQAGYDLILAWINGTANAMRNNTAPLIAAIKNLLDAFQTAAKQMFEGFAPEWVQSGVDLVNGFINGIKSMITDAASWAGNLASRVIKAAKKVLGIKSPSKEFDSIGQYSGSGFVNGLKKYGGKVISEASGMGTSAMDSLKSSMANISDIVNGNINLTPTIRPVLDMGGVTGGLSSVFNKQHSINVASSRAKLATISTQGKALSEIQNGSITQHFSITVTGNQIANDYDVSRIGEKITAQLAREQRRSK